ncbi:chromosomal replication initiator protein DnaA [Epilithonimonas ginsengisoli]|uniref:Chromosomal replication initiator protein DnaA n=1 Tax=Epilithonimonas ginsengisoli TaxID=1245592 RepID=A0ABU4JFQ9_9FLAO|nr:MULTISPECIES: chromosomal replication initiator protein DnaA [Chryseobacterium group]MBV6879822.1 chromosomal replication initiator protein DnaA [Epilithonimonas sp. FP105]MDW8548462.1 chromosomal replication initiator protein DnaA [Epilithonimonas ginsengisoli]OAH75747.1 chromosomal replication initiation protein DnaA [Chryseobacterium sp. FP211-J200]
MNENLVLIWDRCLQFMRDNLNAAEDNTDLKKLENSFDLLFDKVQPISLVNNNLTLLVPSDFYKEYIEDNYLSLLSAALKKNIGKGVKLWYSVMENKPFGKEKPITMNVKGISTQQPKIQEARPVLRENNVNAFAVPGIKKINIDSNLKADQSFDNFIEGESNKFASTVARSIAKRPGSTAFNPLFVYGGYGVGKTHLAQAIGLEVKSSFPEKVVLYQSSEKFIQDFVKAAKSQNKTDFQHYYQMIDVLIIDDIQFLSGKAATQDSFFHIFDYLHQNGKQIILTSDKAPADILDTQERIISRFKWGLSAEIKSPNFETRRKIIVDKLSRDGIELTDDMLDYLASEVKTNGVRELIGVVNAVIAYSTVYKSDFSLDLLKDTINKLATTQKKTINIPYIQEIVCDYFGIQREQLLSKTRKREIALPRQLAMYFAKEYTNATFTKIGEEMGGKDHSTVMYACDTIRDVSKIDKELKKYIKDLKEKIAQ